MNVACGGFVTTFGFDVIEERYNGSCIEIGKGQFGNAVTLSGRILQEQLQAITVAQDSMEAVGALVWQIATKKSLERCRQRRSSVVFQATPPLLGLRLAGVMRLPTQWRLKRALAAWYNGSVNFR